MKMIPIKLMHAKVQKVLHLCRSVSVWVKNRLTPHMMASARGYSAERLVKGSISAAITHETEPYPICKKVPNNYYKYTFKTLQSNS